MITTIKIIKGLGEVEELLIRNITRTLVELEMHIHMSDEQILKYYNIDHEMGEEDRQKLVDDTLRNMDGDIFKLDFYQKNKERLINIYGKTYNKVGDIAGIAQGRADEGMRKRVASSLARERAGEKRGSSNQGNVGPVNDATKSDNAQGDTAK